MCWKRQILAQEVPIAPVMNVVVRRSRSISNGNCFAGLLLDTLLEEDKERRGR